MFLLFVSLNKIDYPQLKAQKQSTSSSINTTASSSLYMHHQTSSCSSSYDDNEIIIKALVQPTNSAPIIASSSSSAAVTSTTTTTATINSNSNNNSKNILVNRNSDSSICDKQYSIGKRNSISRVSDTSSSVYSNSDLMIASLNLNENVTALNNIQNANSTLLNDVNDQELDSNQRNCLIVNNLLDISQQTLNTTSTTLNTGAINDDSINIDIDDDLIKTCLIQNLNANAIAAGASVNNFNLLVQKQQQHNHHQGSVGSSGGGGASHSGSVVGGGGGGDDGSVSSEVFILFYF